MFLSLYLVDGCSWTSKTFIVFHIVKAKLILGVCHSITWDLDEVGDKFVYLENFVISLPIIRVLSIDFVWRLKRMR